MRVLPPVLQRLVAALGHQPPVEDIAEEPFATGPWCWAAPLWGNPTQAAAAAAAATEPVAGAAHARADAPGRGREGAGSLLSSNGRDSQYC